MLDSAWEVGLFLLAFFAGFMLVLSSMIFLSMRFVAWVLKHQFSVRNREDANIINVLNNAFYHIRVTDGGERILMESSMAKRVADWRLADITTTESVVSSTRLLARHFGQDTDTVNESIQAARTWFSRAVSESDYANLDLLDTRSAITILRENLGVERGVFLNASDLINNSFVELHQVSTLHNLLIKRIKKILSDTSGTTNLFHLHLATWILANTMEDKTIRDMLGESILDRIELYINDCNHDGSGVALSPLVNRERCCLTACFFGLRIVKLLELNSLLKLRSSTAIMLKRCWNDETGGYSVFPEEKADLLHTFNALYLIQEFFPEYCTATDTHLNHLERIGSFINNCYSNGGYGFVPRGTPSGLTTRLALASLELLSIISTSSAITWPNPEKVLEFLTGLKRSNGKFAGTNTKIPIVVEQFEIAY